MGSFLSSRLVCGGVGKVVVVVGKMTCMWLPRHERNLFVGMG